MSDIRSLSKRIRGIGSMFSEWAVCVGAMALTVSLSFFLPRMIIPGIVLIIAWQLSSYFCSPNHRDYLRCVRIAPIVTRSLFISAFIMIIALVYSRVVPAEANKINPEIPYITSLILYPVTTIVAAVFYSKYNLRPCRQCKLVLGVSAINNMHSDLFVSNARGQIILLGWLSAATSIIDWTYYLIYYSNSSFSSADKYFFLAVPLIIYILSLLYLRRQFNALADELTTAAHLNSDVEQLSNTLRFIIIREDSLLVTERAQDNVSKNLCLDTPAIVKLPITVPVTDEKASEEFARISGVKDFTLRPLYSNKALNGVSDVYHYAAILDDTKSLPESWHMGNNWMTIPQIDLTMKARVMSGDMSEEIYLVYTITMAWKTYDRRGFRLYPIKNYLPTFRLRDLKNWDVDYNDRHWLKVARFNQDVRFFRLKRYIRNLFGKS